MYTIEYFTGKEWIFVSEWNTSIGWFSLGNDTLDLRMLNPKGEVIKQGKISKK